MRWVLVLAVAAVALRPEADARPRRCSTDRIGRQVVCDSGVPAAAPAAPAPYTFCATALTAGNRTGTWGCINGDGSAPSGDNLGPWVATGSPSSTTGTTCASPSYLTFDASPDYVQSTTAVGSTPAAFTICSLWQQQTGTGLLQTGWFWGVYPCCGSFVTASEESAVLIGYFPSSVSSAVSIAPNDKALVCGSYSGGTAHVYVRTLNGTFSYAGGAASPPSIANAKFTFGSDGAYTNTGKFFGGFYTEKELSLSDMDAIYDAVIGSGCT